MTKPTNAGRNPSTKAGLLAPEKQRRSLSGSTNPSDRLARARRRGGRYSTTIVSVGALPL